MFADSLPEFGLERIGGLWVGVAVAGLLGAAGWWWVWLRRRYRQVTVNGRSMEPMYRDGDRVLVRVVSQRRLRIGDIVVIEQPDAEGIWRTPRLDSRVLQRQWLIKRVAALPGDPVPRDRVPALASVADAVVPLGKVVVLGDAGRRSYDSKQVGYFPLERVLGVAVRSMSRPGR